MNCFFRWFFQCLGAELISLITICQLCPPACATSALTASSSCKSSVHSPEKGEMPRQRLPDASGEADTERGFGAASRGGSEEEVGSEEEGAAWWSSGGTKALILATCPCSCCASASLSPPAGSGSSGLVQAPCALSWLCPCFWSDRDWLLASPLTQPLSWYFSVMACLRSFGWCWHSRPTGFECNGLIIKLNLECMLFEVTQHNWRTNEPCVPRWLFHE